MRTCSKCKEEKETDQFHFKDKTKGTYQSLCKACNKLVTKAHYEANKQHYIQKAAIRKAEVRKDIQQQKALQGCVFCQEKEPVCLDYHHLSDKVDNVSSMISNGYFNDIQLEIDKCIVVCSNCHKKLHAGIITL